MNAPVHALLAYSARDGSARVIPIGCGWTNDVFVVESTVNAPKVTALAADPWGALTVDTSSFSRHVLLVRGEAAAAGAESVKREPRTLDHPSQITGRCRHH